MPQINWNLLQPVDVSASFTQGIEAGQKRREEHEYKNALGAWSQSPDDPAAIANIMRWKPEIGYKIYSASSDRQEKVRKRQQEEKTELNKIIARVAADADTPEKWAAGVDGLVAMGYTEAAKWRDKYSLANRAAAMALGDGKETSDYTLGTTRFSGKTDKPIASVPGEDKWVPVPPGGRLERIPRGGGMPAPAAGSGDIPTLSPEEASRLPPGTPFMTLDGRPMRVRGGPAAGSPATFP